MNVCVLGLGEVGLPSAKYILEKNMKVFGYDINESAAERAKRLGIEATTDWKKIPFSQIYIICVYAGLKNDSPDFSSIYDAGRKVIEKQRETSTSEKCLVSIESTIIPGLCRKLYEEIFKWQVHLVHVPHRFWSGDPVRHGVRQRRVIGAIDGVSMRKGWAFYKDLLKIPLHKVSSIEIAEMSKISEQTFRYIQIAFAEELKMVCNELGMNFDELRTACNTKWNIEIPEAREGIGGHCLPKDSKYFTSLTSSARLVQSAMQVDDVYKKIIHKLK
ncbi:hypothetical protein KEJ15_00180 [Candidatus Bathyarchaeota archaeon]|nr:hypothetical protein [Candidatus Bathyarchaeota archaeon]